MKKETIIIIVIVIILLIILVIGGGLLFYYEEKKKETQTNGFSNGNDSSMHKLEFINNCNFDIYMGALQGLGSRGHPAGGGPQYLPEKGGWLMKAGDTKVIYVPQKWIGRFWPRTGCSDVNQWGQQVCYTGDCGGLFQCDGKGGTPPATLAEFTFDIETADGKMDYYDVSAVDGWNITMAIIPDCETTRPRIGDPYSCGRPGFLTDPTMDCPDTLRVNADDGTFVGCISPCKKGLEPNKLYCCDSPYNCSPHNLPCKPGEQVCDPNAFPIKYIPAVKKHCPNCYSYPYDDPTSLYTCFSAEGKLSSYTIILAPNSIKQPIPPNHKQIYSRCPGNGTPCDPNPSNNIMQCCQDPANPGKTIPCPNSNPSLKNICNGGNGPKPPPTPPPSSVKCPGSDVMCSPDPGGEIAQCCPKEGGGSIICPCSLPKYRNECSDKTIPPCNQ